MKREIEDKLFAEFENGAANLCLDYILKMRVNKCDVSCYPLGVQKYYASIPEQVKAHTEAFDDVAWPVNVKGQYRIAQEISDNLDACGSESAKERYLCGILGVFEEWAKVFTPIADLRTLDKITEANSIYTEGQIKAEKDRLRGLHDQMLAVMDGAEVGSIEYYFGHWHRAYFLFSNMLAGVCAEHNINLLEVQNKRGIWVVEKLDVMQLQMYFGYSGNYNYANSLLKALPKTAVSESLITTEHENLITTEHECVIIPDCQNIATKIAAFTDRAQKYFAKACDAGLMVKQNQASYKWVLQPVGASLAYFLRTVYNPDGTKRIPYKELEHLFGVKRLDSAIDRILNAKKRPKWADTIDHLFES